MQFAGAVIQETHPAPLAVILSQAGGQSMVSNDRQSGKPYSGFIQPSTIALMIARGTEPPVAGGASKCKVLDKVILDAYLAHERRRPPGGLKALEADWVATDVGVYYVTPRLESLDGWKWGEIERISITKSRLAKATVLFRFVGSSEQIEMEMGKTSAEILIAQWQRFRQAHAKESMETDEQGLPDQRGVSENVSIHSNDVGELKRVADNALEALEERVFNALWNEANAIKVVGIRPPVDLDGYHDALDAWSKDVLQLVQLSKELLDAQLELASVMYGRRNGAKAAKKISDNWSSRQIDLDERLQRIRNLRSMRPR